MSFKPPRCVNQECPTFANAEARRISLWGSYRAQCRDEPQQRYRCGVCGKTFSRQTFRHDYNDNRPECNAPLFELLTSGVGLRQAARVLKLGLTSTQKKMRKLARTCGLLHENLSPAMPGGRTYVFDEEESYEQASIRPLTVPMLIEREHWFIVATGVGSIRRLAPAGTARRRKQEREERVRGKRPDESRAVVHRVFEALRRRARGKLELLTDQKSSYATLARKVFGADVHHATTSGKAPRTTRNPLFPINVTIAMSRDNCGRLRRKSWLVSKLAKWLSGQLAIFTVFRNYVRRRFNRDRAHQTPAKWLGLLPRQLSPDEVVGWRQDWGTRSPHPLSHAGDRACSAELVAM